MTDHGGIVPRATGRRVERWLQVNRDAEKAGDWKPLADFYADDATLRAGTSVRRKT